jgi:hypothetical protein
MKRRWNLKQLLFPMVIAVGVFAIIAFIITGCTSCEGDRHEHVFGAPFSKQVNTEANCTITVQKCECGHEEVIASSAHQYTTDEPAVVYENNKAKGYTVKYTCTVCEYYFIQWLSDEQIEAYGLTPVEELNRVHYWTTTETPCTEDDYLAYLTENDLVDNVPVDEGKIACYYKVVRACSDCGIEETVVMRRDEPDPNYVPPNVENPPDEPGDVTDPEPEPEPEPEPIPEPTPGDTSCEHVYVTNKVAPTCNSKGYTEYVCENCSKSYTSDYINATGHRYGDWQVKNATCTADGVKTRECSSCGYKEKQSIKSTGHKYGTWTTTKAATCVTAGTKSQTCSSCGDTKQQTIPATGHNYSSWKTTKAATCELSGTKESTCANCGHTKTEVIAATGHKWDNGKDIVVPTSCSDVGSRRYTCTVCNKKRTEQIKGTHSFGDWVWEDAIIQSGPDKGEPTSKKYHVCKKCNYKEYGNVPEHYCKIYCNGNDKHTIKGTCTKPNVGVEVCRTCGREWRYELGYGDHSWKSEIRHLTDYTEYTNELDVEISTCTACGKKSYSYTEGKGDTSLTKLGCTMQVAIEQGSAYLGGRIISNTEIAHPEWQTVYRNPVYDSNGALTQVTIRWYDKQGNRHSYVLVIADIPDMFSNYDTSGVDPNRITYVLACGSGDYLYASSVGWSG